MKLFTIGDSVSQGFMSGAAARTELCYSTLIATVLANKPAGTQLPDYHFPHWEKGGHPVDLEKLMRKLNRLYGSNIFGPIEWPLAAFSIASFLDDVEDYYERGPGAEHRPEPSGKAHFHNISVRGFDVADAWKVTPALCRERIALDNAASGGQDNTFSTPNASFYRTALSVLNPARDQAKYDQHHALQWLEDHATKKGAGGGVENLILWLGSNNALGTIVDLDIVPTPNDPARRPHLMAQPERLDYNLWHPVDFELEYEELLKQVDAIMKKNNAKDWKVFVGTIPAVTVAPLAKGVGNHEIREDPFGHLVNGARYYRYYTYFIFDEDFAHTSDTRLTLNEAYRIDSTIAEYNRIIAEQVEVKNRQHRAAGGNDRYFVVDINKAFLELAYKRNNEQPTYELPDELKNLNPVPNTKYYHANRRGRLQQGGIFSLDGVHPSAIGQGLVAYEFLTAMKTAGVAKAKPDKLDWRHIIRDDALWSKPISLMSELYEHDTLAEVFIRLMRRKSRREVRPNPPDFERDGGP